LSDSAGFAGSTEPVAEPEGSTWASLDSDGSTGFTGSSAVFTCSVVVASDAELSFAVWELFPEEFPPHPVKKEPTIMEVMIDF
jgi:hypothetical protein